MTYSIAYDRTNKRWIGVVQSNGEVVTVCDEITEHRARKWCEHFAATGEELPDMTARKESRRKLSARF